MEIRLARDGEEFRAREFICTVRHDFGRYHFGRALTGAWNVVIAQGVIDHLPSPPAESGRTREGVLMRAFNEYLGGSNEAMVQDALGWTILIGDGSNSPDAVLVQAFANGASSIFASFEREAVPCEFAGCPTPENCLL